MANHNDLETRGGFGLAHFDTPNPDLEPVTTRERTTIENTSKEDVQKGGRS